MSPGSLEATLGHGHVDVGLTTHNLGVAYLDSGKSGEAIDVLEDALAVLTATLAHGHTQLEATRLILADARLDARRG